MGLSWNSWYNPLDNIASAAKSVTPSFGMGSNGQTTVTSVKSREDTRKANQPIQPAQPMPGNDGGQAPTTDNDPIYGGDSAYDSYAASQAAAQRAAAAAQQREVDYTRSMLDRNLGSLRGILGNIGQTRQQGEQQLDTTYNNSKTTGEAKYNAQDVTNLQDREKALGKVDTNARTGYNSLKRLLGLSGSANQSALKFAAPNAIARVASGERQDQLDNYGKNAAAVQNSRTSFLEGLKNEYDQNKSNFLRGLFEQENDTQAKIGELEMQKAALNGGNYEGIRAAYAPYQSTIDQNNAKIGQIFEQYKAPLKTQANLASMNDFNVDKAAIGADKSMGGEEYSPYAQFLKRKLTSQV